MSASDTPMPLISAPWLSAEGNPLSVIQLPGAAGGGHSES